MLMMPSDNVFKDLLKNLKYSIKLKLKLLFAKKCHKKTFAS